MEDIDSKISSHYFQETLYDKILDGLKLSGVSLDAVKRSDLARVDEFHVRGAAVSEKMGRYAQISGKKILDVGCGIGGPARMLRDTYQCMVTGIDLSETFIEVANKLCILIGMKENIQFRVADATSLPFDDGHFDAVWTQHVQMNINDKGRFYGEISRVLKPGGVFIHYEILKKNDQSITFPVPWASTKEISFLFDVDQMHKTIEKCGMQVEVEYDETHEGILFFEGMISSAQANKLPPLGVHLLMGDDAKLKIKNLLDGLKNGSLELRSGLFRKWK